MKFSERIGKRTIKVDIQIDSIDEDLKNSLWSLICVHLLDRMKRYRFVKQSPLRNVIKDIWFSHFKEPIDKIPITNESLTKELRQRFFYWDYLEIYDFIDFMANIQDQYINNEEIVNSFNSILKLELSGYRFVNGQLAPITNEEEIKEIEKAINSTEAGNLKGVSIHLAEALNKLSDKKNPDYRNSIKESISAVESICQQITQDPKAELGKALKKLKTKIPIHGALEQGFIKIYGYTSDGDGIRHALMDEPNLDQEDALYMLITCSSFVNYLIIKATKMGLIIN